MDADAIMNMDRTELVSYLEGWGFQCYDTETTEELRDAALENYTTEER